MSKLASVDFEWQQETDGWYVEVGNIQATLSLRSQTEVHLLVCGSFWGCLRRIRDSGAWAAVRVVSFRVRVRFQIVVSVLYP
jgi:hypothetical protein